MIKKISKNFGLVVLTILLVVKAVAMVALIAQGCLDLAPDEAQYWTWSQHLDWGYYSKPPGIAWQIWASSQLFGNGELGVRFGAVVMAAALSLAVYFCGRCCGLQDRIAALAAATMALSPLGMMASLLATTDGGLVLFWTLALGVLGHSLARQETPHYWLVGVFIACGALFKWTIFALWAVIVVGAYFFPRWRKRGIVQGIAFSLLGLIPSVIWNAKNHWATFHHVWSTNLSSGGVLGGNFFDFLGAQISLLSPIVFGLLVIAWMYLVRQRETPKAMAFCGWSCLVIVAGYAALALVKKIQGNWCVYAYPAGCLFVSWYVCEKMRRGKEWLVGGLIVSVMFVAVSLTIPYFQETNTWSAVKVPYKMNPFRHAVGWKNLENVLSLAGYDPAQHFIFSDKYQTTSLLNFYGKEQRRSYFLNINGCRQNQFCYWPSMAEEQINKTGFFVWIENLDRLEKHKEECLVSYRNKLQDFFRRVDFVGEYPIFNAYNQPVKSAFLFRCNQYNGQIPRAAVSY